MKTKIIAAATACFCMLATQTGTAFAGTESIFPTSKGRSGSTVEKKQKKDLPTVKRTTGYAGPISHKSYSGMINSYASAYGVPADLAHAVIRVESNFNPKARGAAGEIGLMQIKPATARMMGYRGSAKGLYNPETNIKFGMKYLAGAHKLAGGTTCGTILRYNAGHGAKRMNPISKRYCGKVQGYIN